MNTVLAVPFHLDREDIKSQCAIKPGSRYEPSLERILDEVEKIARPKVIYRLAYVDELGTDTVTVDGAIFHSPALRRNLDDVRRIFPYIATCGSEVENTPIDHADDLEQYWLRVISLALVRISAEHLITTIQGEYRLDKLSTMNPGSAEAVVWPLEEQGALFGLFGGSEAVERAIGVRLLPSYFMVPDMSASGILFPSESTYFNCQLCQRDNCPSRKAEFDAALWESIQKK